MLDIESVKNIVQEFAKKYNFIQQIDIETAEKVADFDTYMKGCYKIGGKKYVVIHEYSDRTEIVFGTIFISVDKDDEGDEEYYGIGQNRVFLIKVADVSDTDALLETMIEKCKEHKFLQ